MNQLSIKGRIYLALGVICSAILLISVLDTYKNEQALAKDLIIQHLYSTSDGYFDAVNTMMVTGTMANRQLYQKKLLQQPGIKQARIIRGEQVVKLYGSGFDDQQAKTADERSALNGQLILKDGEDVDGDTITLIKPIVASADYRGTNCLACHQAKENDVLGAIQLTYSLSHIQQQINANVMQTAAVQFVVVLIGFFTLAWCFRKLITERLEILIATMDKLASETDLTQQITVKSNDEISRVYSALNKVIAKFRNSLQKVSESSKQLIESSQHVHQISDLAQHHVHQQKLGTDSVAAAVNQLEASSEQVKQATHTASNKSESTNELANAGKEVSEKVRDSIGSLRSEIDNSSQIINRLNDKTLEVGNVLEVIQTIAEQTNLLALNAAIEAARAGEQGRGFAVVADEVRTLATRTQESTSVIRDTISQLQDEAKQAVDAMNTSCKSAEQRAEEVQEVALSLESIAQHIAEINDLNMQIANAADEQNYAAEDINHNVNRISEIADDSSSDADKGKEISQQLVALAQALDDQVKVFKI